jgi:hypothetical protein
MPCCKAIKDVLDEFNYPFDIINTVEVNIYPAIKESHEGQSGLTVLRLLKTTKSELDQKIVEIIDKEESTWTKILFCPFCGKRINTRN